MRLAVRRWPSLALATLTLSLTATSGAARAQSVAPLPIGNPVTVAGASALSAIACMSATRCEGVGSNSAGDAVVVGVNGGIPGRALAVPLLSPADELRLSAIACPSATTCEAVGSLAGGHGDTSAVVVTITGGVPAVPQIVPDAAVGDGPVLTGVACVSATTCEAVGAGEDAVATQIRDGAPSPLSHDGDPQVSQLVGVVCAAGTCDALGTGSHGTGIVAPVRAGVLGAVRAVPGTTMLATGGCAAGGGCELLGTDSDGSSLLISDAAGTLGRPRLVRGADLTSVSCLTRILCAAAGRSATGADVLLAIRDGAPTAVVAAPFGPSGEVACGSAQSCVVAGTTDTGVAAVTEIGPAVDVVHLHVGRAGVQGTRTRLRLAAVTACAGRVTETAMLPAAPGSRGTHGRRRVTVATVPFSLPAAGATTVSASLDPAARRALGSAHRLDVQLTVSAHATVHGAPSRVVARRTATIRGPRPRRRGSSAQ